MENGAKNLKGARLFPKTSSNHGFGDASFNIGLPPEHNLIFLPLCGQIIFLSSVPFLAYYYTHL